MDKRVKLSSLRPNPWRQFETYQIVPEKIDMLVESISTTGFWKGQINARQVGKCYEIVFGHHRWIAAQKALGKGAFIEISIEKLTDDDMLMRMARENSEVYTTNAAQDVELVKAALEGYAQGKIHFKKNAGHSKNLIVGRYIDKVSADTLSLSREQLTVKLNLPLRRIADALANLKAIKEDIIEPEDLAKQTPAQSRGFTSEVKKVAAAAGKPAAKKFAKEIAKEIEEKKTVVNVGGRSSAKPTVKRKAAETISKAKGENQDFRKFKEQYETARDKINGARLTLRNLVNSMRDAGYDFNSISGPEVYRFNTAIEDMEESINFYRAQFETKQTNKPQLKVIEHDPN